jgi:hydroxymethylglutaryl-CoA reductase
VHDQIFAFYVVLKIKIPGVFMLSVGVIINGIGIMLESHSLLDHAGYTSIEESGIWMSCIKSGYESRQLLELNDQHVQKGHVPQGEDEI